MRRSSLTLAALAGCALLAALVVAIFPVLVREARGPLSPGHPAAGTATPGRLVGPGSEAIPAPQAPRDAAGPSGGTGGDGAVAGPGPWTIVGRVLRSARVDPGEGAGASIEEDGDAGGAAGDEGAVDGEGDDPGDAAASGEAAAGSEAETGDSSGGEPADAPVSGALVTVRRSRAPGDPPPVPVGSPSPPAEAAISPDASAAGTPEASARAGGDVPTRVEACALTGPDGRFELRGAPARAWIEVSVDAPGCAVWRQRMDLGKPEGSTVSDIGEIVLSSATSLVVEVVGPDGEPGRATMQASFDCWPSGRRGAGHDQPHPPRPRRRVALRHPEGARRGEHGHGLPRQGHADEGPRGPQDPPPDRVRDSHNGWTSAHGTRRLHSAGRERDAEVQSSSGRLVQWNPRYATWASFPRSTPAASTATRVASPAPAIRTPAGWSSRPPGATDSARR